MFKHYLISIDVNKIEGDWWDMDELVSSFTSEGDLDTVVGVYLNIYNLDIEDYINEVTDDGNINYVTYELRKAADIIYKGKIC